MITKTATVPHLLDWTVIRSGAGMTAEGRDFASGTTIKISKIAQVKLLGGEIVALAADDVLLARLAPSS